MGVAAAGEVQGPYRRVLEKKPMMGTADGSPQVGVHMVEKVGSRRP